MTVELDDNAIAQVGSQLVHLELIVDDLPLTLLALDRSKLATTDRVTNGDLSGLHNPCGASKDNSDSCLHHDLIDYLWIALHFKVTFRGNACKT